MASVLTLPGVESRSEAESRKRPRTRFRVRLPLFVLGCSALALCLLGYHPAAEDGGIYAAATALRLHPELFPANRSFAVAQSGRSLFVPLLAEWARLLHLSLDWVLLTTFALAVIAAVAAASGLARQMFADWEAQRGGVLLFAVALGVPVAGTSLYLVDPYLTARSLSTPLLLLALTMLLQRRPWWCALCVAGAGAVHPIMALCALPLFATYVAATSRRAVAAVAGCLLVTALCMAALRVVGPAELPAARAASLTRLYWFPGQWAWFEWLGALVPPLLLLLIRQRCRARLSVEGRALLLATASTALAITAASCCLVHADSRSLLLARLQPLRMLHLTYCIFLPALGGVLVLEARPRRRALPNATVVLAGIGLFLMQRGLYAHSGHAELPGTTSRNGYAQAFLWVRDHTPPDALFALDADYTRAPGEDAQLFRAVALRSALPDAAKDGGVASVVPTLAAGWLRASEAQRGLANMLDSERVQRVRSLHATWLVLPAGSRTAFDCPYRNAAAQVCRLP